MSAISRQNSVTRRIDILAHKCTDTGMSLTEKCSTPTLADLRKRAGLSAEKMAAALNCSKPKWLRVETGRGPIPLDYLPVVARMLKRDPASVLLSLGRSVAWVAEALGRPEAEVEALADELSQQLTAAAGKDGGR